MALLRFILVLSLFVIGLLLLLGYTRRVECRGLYGRRMQTAIAETLAVRFAGFVVAVVSFTELAIAACGGGQ